MGFIQRRIGSNCRNTISKDSYQQFGVKQTEVLCVRLFLEQNSYFMIPSKRARKT